MRAKHVLKFSSCNARYSLTWHFSDSSAGELNLHIRSSDVPQELLAVVHVGGCRMEVDSGPVMSLTLTWRGFINSEARNV